MYFQKNISKSHLEMHRKKNVPKQVKIKYRNKCFVPLVYLLFKKKNSQYMFHYSNKTRYEELFFISRHLLKNLISLTMWLSFPIFLIVFSILACCTALVNYEYYELELYIHPLSPYMISFQILWCISSEFMNRRRVEVKYFTFEIPKPLVKQFQFSISYYENWKC